MRGKKLPWQEQLETSEARGKPYTSLTLQFLLKMFPLFSSNVRLLFDYPQIESTFDLHHIVVCNGMRGSLQLRKRQIRSCDPNNSEIFS